MPRVKTINSNEIKLKKINAGIVGQKNCLGVKLQFNTAFTQEQISVLKEFYRFQVSNDGKTLTRGVKNSWKGLVAMLISISYCRYRDSVVSKMLQNSNRKRIMASWKLQLDFDYSWLLNDDQRNELSRKARVTIPQDEIVEQLLNPELFREKNDQRHEQKYRELLKELPPDPHFENVAAPAEWKALYASYRCKDKDIETHLKMFANLLDIDEERSTVTTAFTSEIPHKYEINPAIYKG